MTSASRYIRAADRALLWARSGGLCCFPECGSVCVLEANNLDQSAIIGEIAHIVASSNTGPRADLSLPNELRNEYENLILLCPTHHTTVDAFENTYTVEDLRRWKTDAETRYSEFLTREMESITFAELDAITQALVSDGASVSTSFSIVPPREKMARNGLTAQTESLINIGLVQGRQVQDFVEKMGGLDRRFIDRLTSGFINAYQQHRQEGLEGDALFETMRLFSSQGKSDIKLQCAGLAVLVYLFERCEVFEQ